MQASTQCIKDERSRGVCTISAVSNGPRQDWLVCPYRALDNELLASMVRRLYRVPAGDPVVIRPVPVLGTEAGKAEILNAVIGAERVFVYFQDKLGGEISLSKTPASPELSFDITVVELVAESNGTPPPESPEPSVRMGKYGVIELQTTDTHGSYKHAVQALSNALDLHGERFPEMLAENPDWAGRGVEGPNISNVFKRTFYQIIFKFQVTKRETSVGCALALPQPVWDSWQPFLFRHQLVSRIPSLDAHSQRASGLLAALTHMVPNCHVGKSCRSLARSWVRAADRARLRLRVFDVLGQMVRAPGMQNARQVSLGPAPGAPADSP